jgi:maltooligosyltrehalose trehalohydrolase
MDDFHHSLHALMTGERDGYYQDFGRVEDLATAYREGFVYSGQYSAFRGRRFGSSSLDVTADRFVVYAQNHDQVGNRFGGERLTALLSFEELKLVAGAILLSPYIPMLFMGEEYGELAPFQYFVSHTDPMLVESVRRGRAEEFAAFGWQGEPLDPQDQGAFLTSKLDHALKDKEPHRSLRDLYRSLLRLRKTDPALRVLDKQSMEIETNEELRTMTVRRWAGSHEVVVTFNFSDEETDATLPAGAWHPALSSTDEQAAASLSPHSFAVFTKDEMR